MVDTLRAPERRATPRPREQSRARYPDRTGFVERPGGRIAYEVYGSGDPPIVFVPPWQIVHSRVWKAQIPDFARRHLVVAWDNLGNGRSDRPIDPDVHTTLRRAANLEAVMDAAGLARAVLVGVSSSSGAMVVLASQQPDRVSGLVFVCPAAPIGAPRRAVGVPFDEPLPNDHGWNKENIHFWRRDYRAYLEYFFGRGLPGAPLDEADRRWGRLGAGHRPGDARRHAADAADGGRSRVRGDVRVDPRPGARDPGHRRPDHARIAGRGPRGGDPRRAARADRGGGHLAHARHPVRVNLLIREFIRQLERRGADARPRA